MGGREARLGPGRALGGSQREMMMWEDARSWVDRIASY